jgi:CheY-like chemotaxis protein
LSNAAIHRGGLVTVEVRQSRRHRHHVADTIGFRRSAELVFEVPAVDSGAPGNAAAPGSAVNQSAARAALGGDITLRPSLVGSVSRSPAGPIWPPCLRAEEPAARRGRRAARGARRGRRWSLRSTTIRTLFAAQENLADAATVWRSSGAGPGLARDLKPAITLDIMPHRRLAGAARPEGGPATRDIPVLLLSVVDQKDLGYRLGAADYLLKPFERDDLLAALHRVAPSCRRLLVVDDDPHVADLVRQSLEDEPYQIDAAGDGVAALEAIAQRRPDVILLDLLMPRMDGFEVIASLQQDAERRDIPVIVLTAKILTRQERRSLKEHALAVIQKGALDRDALMAELKQVLPEPVRPERREARA